MDVPEQYMQKMQTLLGDGFRDYAASFSMPSHHGLRVNPLRKNACEKILRLPFLLGKIDYVENGYYVDPEGKPSAHPYYAAGLYYLQEPSAMLPADRLPVYQGDLILDLCAAPGGKSTALLAKLNGSGLLVANDISASRARPLVKNLELYGGTNYFVTAEDPKKLSGTYGQIFDKILVDAPCSGEGMFRRDPSLIRDWETRGPDYYAPLQKEILSEAVSMLRPGGMLLYSTCTFSTQENEEQILNLLEEYPQLHSVKIPARDGLCEGFLGLTDAVRAFPHKLKGEGHFLALLRKDGREDAQTDHGITSAAVKNAKLPSELLCFLDGILHDINKDRILILQEQVYLMPEGYERIMRSTIRFLRTGLLLGSIKNNRFKPSQALALSLHADDYRFVLNLPSEDERVKRYLRGETIPTDLPDETNGHDILICADGYALGFGKKNGQQLKNGLNPAFRLTI